VTNLTYWFVGYFVECVCVSHRDGLLYTVLNERFSLQRKEVVGMIVPGLMIPPQPHEGQGKDETSDYVAYFYAHHNTYAGCLTSSRRTRNAKDPTCVL